MVHLCNIWIMPISKIWYTDFSPEEDSGYSYTLFDIYTYIIICVITCKYFYLFCSREIAQSSILNVNSFLNWHLFTYINLMNIFRLHAMDMYLFLYNISDRVNLSYCSKYYLLSISQVPFIWKVDSFFVSQKSERIPWKSSKSAKNPCYRSLLFELESSELKYYYSCTYFIILFCFSKYRTFFFNNNDR
jgi:hypothetical protein